MYRKILIISTIAALMALPQFAFADADGAITGGAGGAVAGALVGGPVGAAVGGVAGVIVGGGVTGPREKTIIVQPGPPCDSRTTQIVGANGASRTTQTTNCPN